MIAADEIKHTINAPFSILLEFIEIPKQKNQRPIKALIIKTISTFIRKS